MNKELEVTDHFDFMYRLQSLGITVTPNLKPFRVPVDNGCLTITGTKVEVEFDGYIHNPRSAEEILIKESIDLGAWKHSLHYSVADITEYEKLIPIVKNMIESRAIEIRTLFTAYQLMRAKFREPNTLADEN